MPRAAAARRRNPGPSLMEQWSRGLRCKRGYLGEMTVVLSQIRQRPHFFEDDGVEDFLHPLASRVLAKPACREKPDGLVH